MPIGLGETCIVVQATDRARRRLLAVEAMVAARLIANPLSNCATKELEYSSWFYAEFTSMNVETS
jgi:hypothetical protein